MDDATNDQNAQTRPPDASAWGPSREDGHAKATSKTSDEGELRASEKKLKSGEIPNEKDVESAVGSSPTQDDLVAKEDYSVFTVPQKRAIVLAGSFIGWFSPMTGAIYYPALDQVGVS